MSEDAKVVSETRPTAEGEMLWRVAYSSRYFDNDCRGSGYVPVGAVAFVLAKSLEEAKRKAEPAFVQARKDKGRNEPEEIKTGIVPIETLVPCEEREPLRGYAINKLKQIELTDPEDAKRYKLAVCLVPVGG